MGEVFFCQAQPKLQLGWVIFIFEIPHQPTILHDTARYCLILTDTARYWPILPYTAGYCLILSDTTGYCRILPETPPLLHTMHVIGGSHVIFVARLFACVLGFQLISKHDYFKMFLSIGQWTLDVGHWTLDIVRWTMDNRQWIMDIIH